MKLTFDMQKLNRMVAPAAPVVWPVNKAGSHGNATIPTYMWRRELNEQPAPTQK